MAEHKIPMAGDWVFWHSSEQLDDSPAPAIVLENSSPSLVACLNVFAPNGQFIRRNVFFHPTAAKAPLKMVRQHGTYTWHNPGKK